VLNVVIEMGGRDGWQRRVIFGEKGKGENLFLGRKR
jgi:hypothetical protein